MGGAPLIENFRVFDPVEDVQPQFRTVAKVMYDGRNLYVFVRAYDPRPDSIVALLSRRDVRTPGDHLKVMVDPHHDHRTEYEFAVNPAGVKRDYYTYDDSEEDVAWDGVWDVAARTDSLGWTAEFRIPLSQLRYPRRAEHVFGLMITRDVARTNERSSWPLLRRSRPGIASQFGELRGLVGLVSPTRIEAAPYVVSKNVSRRTADGFSRAQQQSVGGDLKIGVGSALTLDATANPDFGQVEADPAVLNLTAFEPFFEERRPFFVEGTGIFRFGEEPSRLFHSRRIGRAPQLALLVPDLSEVPVAATILGATKLTGRLSSGMSVGALAAVTERERAGTTLVEPATGYGMLRMSQDLRRGESGVGAIATGVFRDLDAVASPAGDRLRRSAIAGGVDVRHRFGGGRYSLAGSLAGSFVSGSEGAIARTQRSGVHSFERADDGLDYDTTRTRLAGTALELSANELGGAWHSSARYLRISPGFETNDIGFLPRADLQTGVAFVEVVAPRPRAFWRTASATIVTGGDWTAAGLPTANLLELIGFAELQRNNAQISANLWAENLAPTYCDRCARGGPALRLSPTANLLLNLRRDPRRRVAPLLAAIYTVGDGGRSTLWRVRPYVTVRARSNLTWEIGLRYQRNRDHTQWYGNVARNGDPATGTAHLFARLDQHLLSFTARLSYTATPTLSLQFYAEPFVSAGRFDNVRALSGTPRAKHYDSRFESYDLGGPTEGFNEKQFRSSAVLRWEYRPGSALFVVWTQGRDQSDRDAGSFSAGRDYRNLIKARPDNTLLVKASYWLGR